MIKPLKKFAILATLASGSVLPSLRHSYADQGGAGMVLSDPTPEDYTIEDMILEKAKGVQVIMFGEKHTDAEGKVFKGNSEYVSKLLPYLKERGFNHLCLEREAEAQGAYNSYLAGKITKKEAIRQAIAAIPCVKSFDGSKVVFKDYANEVIASDFENAQEKISKYARVFRDICSDATDMDLDEAVIARDCGMKTILYDDNSHVNSKDAEELMALRDKKEFGNLEKLLKNGDKLVIECGFMHMGVSENKKDKHTLADYIRGLVEKEKVVRIGLQQESLAQKNIGDNIFIELCSDTAVVVEQRLMELEKYKR